MKLKPSQLVEFLRRVIPLGYRVLVVGMPGIGKSDIVGQATEAVGISRFFVTHPAVQDPTDLKGMPWIAEGKADFYPFGEVEQVLQSKERTVWFLDDLGQGSSAVQAAYMQFLLGGRLGNHVLPDCVTMLAATNRRTDRAAVTGILEPVKSRFLTIVELVPDLDDWIIWALRQEFVPPELIAFLRFRPDLLAAFEPTADLTNSPTPRTWSNVGKILQMQLPSDLESPVIAGSAGEGAAAELLGFLRMYRELPDMDSIIAKPDSAMIPKSPDVLYAISTGLAARANAKNYSNVIAYAHRLYEHKHGEFAALIIKDSTRRSPELLHHEAFVRASLSDLGKLIANI